MQGHYLSEVAELGVEFLSFFERQDKLDKEAEWLKRRRDFVKMALLASNTRTEWDQEKLFPEYFPKTAEEFFQDMDLAAVEWMVPDNPGDWAEIEAEMKEISVALNQPATFGDGSSFKLDKKRGPLPDFTDVPEYKPTTLDFSAIPNATSTDDDFDNGREWL